MLPQDLCITRKKLQFFDLIYFYNCLLIAEHLNQDLPLAFSGYFTYMANIHNHNTRGALKKLVNVPQAKTSFYGTRFITAKSVKDWNNLQNKAVFEFHQEQVSIPKLISTLKKYFITSYSDQLITNKKLCFVLFYFISFAHKI